MRRSQTGIAAMPNQPPPRRGLVLGCGGTVGGAWQVGVLASLEHQLSWDARTADVIVGTSAGATLATMLGAGVEVDEIVAAHRGDPATRPALRRFLTQPPARLPRAPVRLPTSLRLAAHGLWRLDPFLVGSGLLPKGSTRASVLDLLIDDLVPDGGWVDHPATWIVSCDTRSGKSVAFGSPGAPAVPIRRAVRASWAIPGWFPPVRMNESTWIDGGVRSPTSAQVVRDLELDEVIVVAPMASLAGSRAPGPRGFAETVLRRHMTATLRAELEILSMDTMVITPEQELVDLGANLMDPRRRLVALEAGLDHGRTGGHDRSPVRLLGDRPTAVGRADG